MPYKLHLPQKCKMALSKKVFTSNLLPIATLGGKLVPENLRFFLQGDLEREAIWPRDGKDRTADGCTGAWGTAIPKTEGARRKEINILEFGILGHPDFLPLLKNAYVFFLNFCYGYFLGLMFWRWKWSNDFHPSLMRPLRSRWDCLVLPSAIDRCWHWQEGLRQKNLAKWASKRNLDWLVDIDFSMGMIITTLPKKVLKLIPLRKS